MVGEYVYGEVKRHSEGWCKHKGMNCTAAEVMAVTLYATKKCPPS